MSKKDKRRREGRLTEETGWLGDERGSLSSSSRDVTPTTRRSTEVSADAPHDGGTPNPHTSSVIPPAVSDDHEPLYIPKLAPVSLTADGASQRPDDLGDETAVDIAPIGPTEVAAYAMDVASTGPRADEAAADKSAPIGPSVDSQQGGAPTSNHSPSVEQLEQHIRDLEAKLDAMIHASEPAQRPAIEGAEPKRDEPKRDETKSAEPKRTDEERRANPVMEQSSTARELLPAEFYLKQWGRSALRSRTDDVDEFGLDPELEQKLIPSLDFLYKHYFRVALTGADQIPKEGRCLIVANHSGGPLPYDGLMLRTAIRLEASSMGGPEGGPPKPPRAAVDDARRSLAAARELRWLAEDFLYYLPFAGTLMNRLGAVRACQENAERLLAGNKLVAVFPEGVKGIGKLFRDRYKLQRFGRGGFIRLCLRTRTPIVPAAIVGAEEANPMLYRIEYMAKALGLPYLPVTPTFPALGALGLVPAPTKWRVAFGEPIRFDSYGPEAADDEILVGRLSDRVRATIQAMLDRTLADRRSVWF